MIAGTYCWTAYVPADPNVQLTEDTDPEELEYSMVTAFGKLVTCVGMEQTIYGVMQMEDGSLIAVPITNLTRAPEEDEVIVPIEKSMAENAAH